MKNVNADFFFVVAEIGSSCSNVEQGNAEARWKTNYNNAKRLYCMVSRERFKRDLAQIRFDDANAMMRNPSVQLRAGSSGLLKWP